MQKRYPTDGGVGNRAHALPLSNAMRKVLLVSVSLLACSRSNPEDLAVSSPAPPPSAALVRLSRSTTLDYSLALLQRELAAALKDADKREDHLFRAEAITDRLLESQLPFAWMKATSYGVEPRVRQIQALADRILAEIRSGLSAPLVTRDIRELDAKVTALRAGLRAGGGPAPPSLEALLAAYAADTLASGSDRGE
jgi:hypothetical protein